MHITQPNLFLLSVNTTTLYVILTKQDQNNKFNYIFMLVYQNIINEYFNYNQLTLKLIYNI